MIELAPNHKSGLPVANPILLAGGTIGYGEAVHASINLAQFGAVTVGPLMLHSRAGSAPPRLTMIDGGFLLDNGLQNRGLDAVVRNFSRLWSRIGCPVLVQVIEDNPRSLSRIVQRLEQLEGVAGIELLPTDEVDKWKLRTALRALTESCDFPVLVKLPLGHSLVLAETCAQSEAAGVIIGNATMVVPGLSDDNSPRQANLYGPVVFGQMLDTLYRVAQLGLDCSLLACGGIYTAEHVQQALAAGALAVQIDSAIWGEPGLPEKLLQAAKNQPA